MQRLGYGILISLLWLMALLPLRVLYVFSDIFYFIVYKVAGYRRGVVRDNLRSSFPEKSDDERLDIERRFYRHFCDSFFETVKLLHISDATMRRRMEFENQDLIDRFTSEGRSVAVYFGHCFNWEWAPSVTLHVAAEGVTYCQVYRHLNSHIFNRLMLKIRSRFGSVSIDKDSVARELLRLGRRGPTVTGFMSDQKPGHGEATIATMFLNHPTAFIEGTAQLALRMHMGVIYWDMHRTGRGHYRIVCRLLHDGTTPISPEELTLRYVRALEQTIRREPDQWLWSHKRWKIPVTCPLI